MPTLPPVRMIATDLDGTLLRSDGTVTKRVRHSLLAAKEAGIEVVPATGRPHVWAEDIVAKLDFIDHWVFANGSVTWHAGREEVVRAWWLDHDVAVKLVHRLRQELPGVALAVEFGRSVVYEAGFTTLAQGVMTLDPADDILNHLNGNIQKLLVLDQNAPDREDLYHEVDALVGADAVTTYSGLSFVELGGHRVSKATALEELAADMGIDHQEVAAFGDFHNDLEMLRWAGRSFAMGHASDDVKEAAGEVIGSNDANAVPDMVDHLVAEHG